MIIPERVTQQGRVVSAFQIDDCFADEIGRWKWWMDNNGYIKSNMKGKKVNLSRYIWLLHTGDWPKQEIDHINRDPLDNRVRNLRDVSRSENNKNWTPLCRLGMKFKNKKSGLPAGVAFSPKHKSRPYKASVYTNGKAKHLGRFTTAEEATAAYQLAVQQIKGGL